MRAVAEQAEDTFQREYFILDQWFQKYDALYLLSYCATYFLTHPEGIDPEAKGWLDFYPHYLEILQAFSLMQDRSSSPFPLQKDADRLRQLMGTIGQAISFRTMKELFDRPQEEIEQYEFLWKTRMQTTAVRNWGYPQHMRKVTHALAETIRDEFTDLYQVDPVRFVDSLFDLAEMTEYRLNQHRDRVRAFWHQHNYNEVASSYIQSFPDVVDLDADRRFDMAGKNLEEFKSLLVLHTDLKLANILTFTLDDIMVAYGEGADGEALQELFDKLAIEFGGLHGQNKEYVILDNPVWRKPFIKVDQDSYFSAVISLLPHYALRLFESLASANRDLGQKYRNRKASYLEDELENLFRESFPSGKLYRGSLWYDGAGISGENDLTVIVDSVAIVVEAKSGLLSPPASRGAPERVRRTVRELVDEPSEQAYGFIKLLKSKQNHTFRTNHGTENKIDTKGVRYFIPLAVTLEQFGSSFNLRELVETGITNKKLQDLALVVNLTDLMATFEILNLQSEKIHYLARRRDFNAHVRYNGDELDVLAFYLEHGFNIGEYEYSGEVELGLWMFSVQLSPYFVGKYSGYLVDKPRLAMTYWWRRILQRIETRQFQHWLDAALLLLNVPYDDQKKLKRQFEKLNRRIRYGKLKAPFSRIVLLVGPPQRQFCVVLYPYMNLDRDVKNSVISEVLEDGESQQPRGVVCIGIDLDEDIPYSDIALSQLPDLFDELKPLGSSVGE